MCEKLIFKKLKFNKRYNIIGDFDFIIRASLKYKIGCIAQPLAYYRMHDTNFSKNFNLFHDELQRWVGQIKIC